MKIGNGKKQKVIRNTGLRYEWRESSSNSVIVYLGSSVKLWFSYHLQQGQNLESKVQLLQPSIIVNNYAILVNLSDPTVLVSLLSRFLLITLSLFFLGTFLCKLRYSFLLQTDQRSWVWGRVCELTASYFTPLFLPQMEQRSWVWGLVCEQTACFFMPLFLA